MRFPALPVRTLSVMAAVLAATYLGCATQEDSGPDAQLGYHAAGSAGHAEAGNGGTSAGTSAQITGGASGTSTQPVSGMPGSAGNPGVGGMPMNVAGAAGTSAMTGGSAGAPSAGMSSGGSAGADPGGNPSGGTSMMVPPDTTAPSTPGNLETTSITSTSVTLTWSASTDNVGVTGYRLFTNNNEVATVTGTIHTFKNLNPGTGYTFGIDAYDAQDNHSARANKAAVTTGGAACDATTKVVTLSHAQSYSVNGTACIELTTNPAWGNVDVLLEQTAGTTISYTYKACNGSGMGTIATDAHLYVGANPNCSFYVQLTGSGTVTYYD